MGLFCNFEAVTRFPDGIWLEAFWTAPLKIVAQIASFVI